MFGVGRSKDAAVVVLAVGPFRRSSVACAHIAASLVLVSPLPGMTSSPEAPSVVEASIDGMFGKGVVVPVPLVPLALLSLAPSRS